MDKSPLRTYPRWLLFALGTELVLPCLMLLVMVPEPVTLAVPLAGPWAARLYGHSCGIDSFAPLAAWGLLALGILCIALIIRVKSTLALLPAAALWWPAWLFAAFLSVINTLE
ncbi:MAG: hypothetical protein P1V81_15555 [Planctomycetota bacterium]|nr:hypothetical protein [Planctomycetota bacterium]